MPSANSFKTLTAAAVLFGLLIVASFAQAQMTSYHLANPIGTMYQLPVGETPGWSTGRWFNFEFVTANIWNHSFSMTDTRNGNIYTYMADYEQETAIAELGYALSPSWAVAVEVPYQNHNGGFMDDAVDHFHQLIGSDRFERDVSPKFGNHFIVQSNGVNRLVSEHAEGVGNFKIKLKYWLWHMQSSTPGACDCGLSFSTQVKVPVQSAAHSLSSGSEDFSGLVHFGLPVGSLSGFWLTAAATKLGPNPVFAGWPQRDWQQMYEASLNVGLTSNWGVVLQMRYESPLFDKTYLSFNYTSTSPLQQLEDRVSSGWNALVEWRGSEDIGIRYRWGAGNQINFLFVEDWGIGNQDQSSDGLYINDAPDFQFMTQWHFVF